MAVSSILQGTHLTAVVEQSWRPRFSLESNEERVVSRGFEGPDGVTKMGNTMNISKIQRMTVTNLTTTAQMDASLLSYNTNTEANITVSARDDYAAVSVGRNTVNRMLRSADLLAGYKKQLQSALATAIDVQCASLVPSLATNIVGSGAVPISKSLLLSGLTKLVASAKGMFKLGTTSCYLTVHALRTGDLLNIPEITAADVRGDSMNPNVTGRVWKAWSMDVAESGNISTSGGAAHNLLHISPSHVLAYNEEPNLLDPQENGLATIIIAYTNYGTAEVWDEYAVDIQTQTA